MGEFYAKTINNFKPGQNVWQKGDLKFVTRKVVCQIGEHLWLQNILNPESATRYYASSFTGVNNKPESVAPLPCAYCGPSGYGITVEGPIQEVYFVECQRPGCRAKGGQRPTRLQAISMWNACRSGSNASEKQQIDSLVKDGQQILEQSREERRRGINEIAKGVQRSVQGFIDEHKDTEAFLAEEDAKGIGPIEGRVFSEVETTEPDSGIEDTNWARAQLSGNRPLMIGQPIWRKSDGKRFLVSRWADEESFLVTDPSNGMLESASESDYSAYPIPGVVHAPAPRHVR